MGIAAGSIALIGLVLFLTRNHLFLGLGGMERVVAYPMVLWMLVYGVFRLSRPSPQLAV